MHEAEFRRCLIEADVAGMMRVWAATAPHLAQLNEADTFLALHMARVDTTNIPLRLREYSLKLLEEYGIERHNGRWSKGPPKKAVIAETVGIASMGLGGRTKLNDTIVQVMTDGLQNARVKGIVEPIEQRQAMLDARQKFKFRYC